MASPQTQLAPKRSRFAVCHRFVPDAPDPQEFLSSAEADKFQNTVVRHPTILDDAETIETTISDHSELSIESKLPIYLVEQHIKAQADAAKAAGREFKLPITIR